MKYALNAENFGNIVKLSDKIVKISKPLVLIDEYTFIMPTKTDVVIIVEDKSLSRKTKVHKALKFEYHDEMIYSSQYSNKEEQQFLFPVQQYSNRASYFLNSLVDDFDEYKSIKIYSSKSLSKLHEISDKVKTVKLPGFYDVHIFESGTDYLFVFESDSIVDLKNDIEKYFMFLHHCKIETSGIGIHAFSGNVERFFIISNSYNMIDTDTINELGLIKL